MAVSLATPAARQRLATRHPPYWHRVTRGISVGYRNQVIARPTWYARVYVKGEGYVVKAIGAADDTQPADGKTVLTWKEAVQRALDLNPQDAKEAERTVTRTLMDVGTRYFTHRRARSRSARSVDYDQIRWRTYVLPVLGDHDVTKLTTGDLRRWLDQMVTNARKEEEGEDEAPADASEVREAQRAAQATANRVWTILRAVLNFAFTQGYTDSNAAWRRVRPYENVDKPRTRVLTQPEAVALLAKLEPEFAPLARAALYTGLRLGELLALRGHDVQVTKASAQVHVRQSKTDRARYVPLSDEGAAFFAGLTKGRPDDALVLGLEDEGRLRVRLSRKMRAACEAAGIVPAAVFHDLRRSYGSLMLNSGASMDQISVALGHMDLRMTRRTYAHLSQENLAKAINKHLPSFNASAPKKKRAAKKKRARSAGRE